MSSTVLPSKSGLKPPAAASKDPPAPSTLSREDRNRQLALYHAHLIQSRKDIESLILASIETLLDLPTSPTAPPSEPSTEDVKTVKESLRPFQPSDYDALVEERNIDHKCGYVLCQRKNKKQYRGSKYRIITGIGSGKGSNLKVVEPKELERWCSDQCGKMALFLRVQLSEEPAWMRDWQANEPLDLYGESEREARMRDGNRPPRVAMGADESDAKQTLAIRMKDLAVERGDRNNTAKASARVAIDVRENDQKEQIPPLPPSTERAHAGSIEGYIPIGKHLAEQENGQHEDTEEDMMPTI
ncbi:MAG: hypothetical protein Q9224_002286 [Gallowayella concinna]